MDERFQYGDSVRVRVDWLPVPEGAEGEVLGFAFRDPISYLVKFATGTYVIPGLHLELCAPRRIRSVGPRA